MTSLMRPLLALALASLLGACASLPAPSTSLPTPPPTPDLARSDPPTPGAGDAKPADTPAAAPVEPVAEAKPPLASPPTDEGVEAVTVDPLRPRVPIDLEDHRARLDLWTRIRDGFAIANLDTPLVRNREQSYASQPEYVQRMMDRGGRYLFHIVEEVQRRKMPTEIALLPFIESAFNPQALSRARASGMWQFMPGTGTRFELRQNVFRDDRRHVLASTDAALDYLGQLHEMFKDWHLALAAYNWGEGNVRRAIAFNRARGLPTDYLSLRMPAETRYYVPKLQAVENIVSRPDAFGLALPRLENHPYFLAVKIERDIDVELAARLAGVPLDDFKALNPQFERPVILAAGTPQVLLPYDNADAFVKALAKHRGPTATWTAWTVPATMKAADAAARVGMSDEGFRTINHIPPKMLVKGGSTVLVPRTAARQADVAVHVADHASLVLAHETPPQRKVVWRVGKRTEPVAAVARLHGVSAQQLAKWNGVSERGSFAPGTRVTLYVPVRDVSTTSARVATKGKATKRTATRAHAGPRHGMQASRLAQGKAEVRR